MKRHILPIFGIVALWAFIVVRNYTPGTWLTGWDNLHPEFDFTLNIKRSLFAVWQEYQGLGLLGGMGHIAALPRELILWFFSLILPISTLRYLWTFLMLLLGPLGAYALTWHLTSKSQSNTKQQTAYLIGAWTAGIFYLFNLNTVQTFVAPYEAFITNYAALPWLLWAAVRFFDTPNRRTVALYGLISVLGMTHAYIPTLFLVYVITLAPIAIAAVLRVPRVKSLQAVGALIGTTICINAIWALPFAYFVLTNSSVVVNSKINQMATQEIYLKNQKYGTLIDTLRLKNFWFDTVDFDPTNQGYIRMLEGWPEFTSSSLYQWTSATLVILVLGGWVIMLKRTRLRAWSIVGLIAFTMVAVDTLPFSTIISYLRDHVPLLAQFFRFPFTKWGTTLSLIYALSLAVAVSALMGWLEKKRTFTMLIPLLFAVSILPMLSHLPIFYQPLISPLMKRGIPQEYVALYNAMKAQPSGRIAYLPMQSFWDWKYFRWGYFGSGFLWYGLEQPVLDQAFDSWSSYNENYYWELSRAVYSKHPVAVEQVFAKYDIGFIVLDENIVSANNNRSLYTEEIKAMLGEIRDIGVIWEGGKLTLYEVTSTRSNQFITLASQLPTVSPSYRWTDNDVAYGEVGDYIVTANGKRQTANGLSYVYPFRSLFTKRRDAPVGASRSVDEREFDVEENEDTIIIRSLLLHSPGSVAAKEKVDKKQNGDQKNSIDDAGIKIEVNNINLGQIYHTLFPGRVLASEYEIHEQHDYPQQTVDYNRLHKIGRADHKDLLSSQMASNNDTMLNDKLALNITDQSGRPVNTVGNMTNDPTQPAERLVNNPDNTRVTDRAFRMDITSTVTGDAFRVNVIFPKADTLVYDSTKSADLVAENVKPCGVLREGEATAQNHDQFLRFTSRNQRGCLSFGAYQTVHPFGVGNLPHRDGYLVAVESRHISGRPLLFSLINETAKHVELEVYLENAKLKVQNSKLNDNEWQTDYFVLPPLAADGLGYTVYLSNDAIGRQETINDIKSIKIYRIPYQEMVTMRSITEKGLDSRLRGNDNIQVDHPNPAYYKIEISDKREAESKTLILSQSFDPGWTAWERIPTFPFLRRLTKHVLVNNWENGWVLKSDQSDQFTNPTNEIVIFFLPQLLEWLGFAFLPVPFLYAFRPKTRE